MKTINTLRKRKAISPVIATVILVAVAISVSVGVSYWMSGIAGQYTSFEKIEITSGYAVKTGSDWTITMTLKNSGSSTATITNCFINEQIIGTAPLAGVTAVGTIIQGTMTAGDAGTIGVAGITIDSGESVEVVIGLILSTFSSSGTTLNVKLHSAGGMDYIRLIQLT